MEDQARHSRSRNLNAELAELGRLDSLEDGVLLEGFDTADLKAAKALLDELSN